MAKTQKATKISSTGRLQSISLEEFSMSGIDEELLSHMTMCNTITKFMKGARGGIPVLDDIYGYYASKINEMVQIVDSSSLKGGSIKLKKNKTRKRK